MAACAAQLQRQLTTRGRARVPVAALLGSAVHAPPRGSRLLDGANAALSGAPAGTCTLSRKPASCNSDRRRARSLNGVSSTSHACSSKLHTVLWRGRQKRRRWRRVAPAAGCGCGSPPGACRCLLHRTAHARRAGSCTRGLSSPEADHSRAYRSPVALQAHFICVYALQGGSCAPGDEKEEHTGHFTSFLYMTFSVSALCLCPNPASLLARRLSRVPATLFWSLCTIPLHSLTIPALCREPPAPCCQH